MRTLLLFLLLTLPLIAAEPKTVKLTLSPETTYLTEPLLPDGRIDYLAAINATLAERTTPENNLFLGIFTLIKSEPEIVILQEFTKEEDKKNQERQRKYREEFAAMIGLDSPPSIESLADITPFMYDPGFTFANQPSVETKDYEEELLECYSKEELAVMIETKQKQRKEYYKESFDEKRINKEEYEKKINKVDTNRQFICRVIIEDQWYEALRQPWTAKEFPLIAKWLETTNELAPKLIALSKERTGYYHPQMSESGLFYDVPLPYVQTLRLYARYFEVRGNFEFAKGNYDEAFECAFASIRLGRTLRNKGCWIVEVLVGNAMIGLGHYQLTTYLAALTTKKDAAWIMQKKKKFDSLKKENDFGETVPLWCLHERLAVLNATQAIAVNHPTVANEYFKVLFGDDEVFARYEKLFHTGIEYDWDEILRRINLFYDDMDDVALLPNWQRRLRAAKRFLQRIAEHEERSKRLSNEKPEQQAVDFMLGHLAPGIEAMLQALARNEWSQQIVSITFALAAYRAENDGAYPESLSQLVPKYLDSVPVSLYTNKPMRYIKRAKDVLITNDDEFKLDGSEEDVEKRIAEAKPGEWVYPAVNHHVFVAGKEQ